MNIRKEFFSDSIIAADLFDAMCGDFLGSGEMRSVYRYKFNTKMVVKFEHTPKVFANVSESDVWNEVKGDRALSKWFAPILDISPCGTILWQTYVSDLPENKLPTHVPEFFCDLKRDNWGLWRGRPVCRDYGNHAAFQTGLSLKMKKAKWRP